MGLESRKPQSLNWKQATICTAVPGREFGREAHGSAAAIYVESSSPSPFRFASRTYVSFSFAFDRWRDGAVVPSAGGVSDGHAAHHRDRRLAGRRYRHPQAPRDDRAEHLRRQGQAFG